MKKFLTAFLFAVFAFVFTAGFMNCAQAATEVSKNISGTVSKITYSQSGNSEEIRIYTTKTNVLRKYVIAPNQDCKNYRIGIEISDAVINQNGSFDINKGSVFQIRYANKTNPQAASIVIETTKKPDYTVTVSSDGKYLLVKLNGSLSGQTSSNTSPGTPSTVNNTTSVSSSTSGSSTTQVKAAAASSTSTSQSPATSTQGSIGPISVSTQGDTCLVKFNGINLNSPFGSTGKTPTITLRQKEKILQITLPGKDSRITDGVIPGNSVIHGVLVNYNQSTNSTIIRIAYNNNITYSQEVSGGSTTIKIKASGTSTSGGSGTSNSGGSGTPGNTGNTGSSGSTGNSGNSGSTGGSTSGPSGTDVSRGGSSSGSVSNIQPGDGKTVALKLVGNNIVSKYRIYAGNIISENDAAGSAYAFMFPVDLINLGNGTLSINNALVSTVTTLTTPTNSFLQIHKKNAATEFTLAEGSSANELLVIVKSGGGNTSGGSSSSSPANATNPSGSARGKLVVLDAGHGGSDPGTIFGEYSEKTFNLDITLKTAAILQQKGINVRLTRSSDVFVGLEERANMANEWGADLFVSIHNNSMPEGIRGSMAFYYPTSAKGKTYAKLILDNMYEKLGMGYMGASGLKSAEYVVLKKTKMPAVLVEVACMSHEDDLNLLKSETFRQKAAEVLADSIIQILNQM